MRNKSFNELAAERGQRRGPKHAGYLGAAPDAESNMSENDMRKSFNPSD